MLSVDKCGRQIDYLSHLSDETISDDHTPNFHVHISILKKISFWKDNVCVVKTIFNL